MKLVTWQLEKNYFLNHLYHMSSIQRVHMMESNILTLELVLNLVSTLTILVMPMRRDCVCSVSKMTCPKCLVSKRYLLCITREFCSVSFTLDISLSRLLGNTNEYRIPKEVTVDLLVLSYYFLSL